VRFLGYVTATELRAIYHAAQFVIFPSLFEGGGLPVLESFHESVPVACSNVTALPEYAGDAALLFHPFSIESIADVLRRMTTDADLRETLRQRGSARIRLFTWERTAKTYRALYRQVARAPLSDEDRALLTDSVG
jgi:glycosyltransferase involved in cell wall biosynthesis